ncbi:phosphatidate cytidylyltransferase [Aliikangiella coralliicola]|uniref:Phosphatidate cytidylyltransferase n=1 Tax=Aliikangiella coralliicola TaxID=2592383 RepID=A0A545UB00_9GAMM|nr:phosphatidate cytidylyltransferase [Aliikangiella coralliicola]TQV86640.1 CDP-archaeol synthase [Aliikangiella coralliicola]
MLKQRILTALFLLPLIVVLFFLTQLEYFATAVAIIVYLVALEWAKLAGIKSSVQGSFYALAISVANIGLWFIGDDFLFWPSLSWPNTLVWDYPMIILMSGIVAVTVSVVIAMTYSSLPKWWANLPVRGLLGFALLPALFVALVSIRKVDYLFDFYRGGALVLFMFCMIWAADTGAYITGKIFGKNKLAPVVSPNKTWEGVFGGLFLSVTIAWVGAYLLKLDINDPLAYSLVAFGLAVLSVLGDLFESAMKRVANIKDSGNLLPGHGGVLDRLDSTIAVAPFFFLSYSYFGWF